MALHLNIQETEYDLLHAMLSDHESRLDKLEAWIAKARAWAERLLWLAAMLALTGANLGLEATMQIIVKLLIGMP